MLYEPAKVAAMIPEVWENIRFSGHQTRTMWTVYMKRSSHCWLLTSARIYIYYTGENPIGDFLKTGLDGSMGGQKDSARPMWDPRHYFLIVMSIRTSQVTMEWSCLMQTVENYLEPIVSAHFMICVVVRFAGSSFPLSFSYSCFPSPFYVKIH